MGQCASLFYSTDIEAQTLHRRIRPTEQQYESQQAEWNNLRDFIVMGLSDDCGLSIDTWLQGSYKFGTQIRPSQKGEQFDIDLGIYAIWSGAPSDGPLGPAELKARVQALLKDYANADEEGRCTVHDPKERCNRIQIGHDFHIDTPCYHLDRGADARNLATESDNWEPSDPKAIYLWWREAFPEEFRARARRIVQYFKMWAALTFSEGSRPSSVMLTVLVAQAIKKIQSAELSGDDEWFSAIATLLANEFDLSIVSNPVDSNENLNRLSASNTRLIESSLIDLNKICEKALGADNKVVASEIWSEAFKQFFPLPEDTSLKESAGSLVPFKFDPQVSILARTRTGAKKDFTGLNRIGPIPRDCDIYFEIQNSDDLPLGSIVKWVVRNEGNEAEEENDLGHTAGDGLAVNEHSAYRGNHFMDVSIWKFGQLIGRRRIPVVISGLEMPSRNPPRPTWTKLRKKRN